MALQEEAVSSLGELPEVALPSELKWKKCGEWLNSPSQRPYFVGYVQKVNRRMKKQKRVLLLTKSAVASCRTNGKVTRAFSLEDVKEVWVQSLKGGSKEVVFKVPTQYDLQVLIPPADGEKMLIVLSALLMEATSNLANVINVMAPYAIGNGDYVVRNAKPQKWCKGQHMVHVREKRVDGDVVNDNQEQVQSPVRANNKLQSVERAVEMVEFCEETMSDSSSPSHVISSFNANPCGVENRSQIVIDVNHDVKL